MIEYGNLGISFSELNALGNDKAGDITNYTGAYYSLRDNEGTERYDFIKDAKPLTHVKMNYGIYIQGDNKCVLIQREDDTLWKYVIETGELVRLDEAINGSEVLKSTDPEPEKSEPEKTEPEKTEPKEAAPAGDVSGDGKVDVTDLTTISLALLGDLNLTDAQSKLADINHNGKVDLSDLATLRQFLSKKIDSLG